MAGKPLTQTESKALAYAVDCLTKNQMADLLIDLAKLQVGIEDASDEAVLVTLQQWLDPIFRARGDGVVKLQIKYEQYVSASDLVRSKNRTGNGELLQRKVD